MGNIQVRLATLAAMRRLHRFVPLAALLAGAAIALTACVQAPQAPVRTPEPTSADPSVAPALVPDGSAEDNLPFFDQTLRAYAQSDSPLQGEPIVNALVAAGFDKANMQVSFDESKTGHIADSMYVSVRFGESCDIGQLVAVDRSVVAVTEATVGPNKDLCLIGNTRTIDW